MSAQNGAGAPEGSGEDPSVRREAEKSGRFTRTYNSARTKGESTARKAKEWTESQEKTSRPGVAIEAFNRYREADGPLYGLVLTAYALIAILPTALVVSTFVRSNPDALANRMIDRLHLTGTTATQFREILTGASGHKFVALLIAIGSVVFSALGFGRAMQRVTAGAWRLPEPVNDTRNQIRCQVWFLTLLSGIIVIVVVNVIAASAASWITYALLPVWFAATVLFFTWTPGHLLNRQVSGRDALHGGVVTGVGILGLQIASVLVLTNWLNWYSKYYGTLGIVLAFIFWLMLIMSAIVGGAAFAGAYAERHRALKDASVATVESAPPAPEQLPTP